MRYSTIVLLYSNILYDIAEKILLIAVDQNGAGKLSVTLFLSKSLGKGSMELAKLEMVSAIRRIVIDSFLGMKMVQSLYKFKTLGSVDIQML